MTPKAQLSRAALSIAVVGSAFWFLIAMTQAEAPLAFVQATAVGGALYVLLHEGCRPIDQTRRAVPWRRR